MATWRYIKGSEKDFESAPEWATLRTHTGGNTFFAESHKTGAKVRCITQKNEFTIEVDEFDESDIYIIAQRERVTSVNDDRLVQALITERGSRYGKFADSADIMQQLKDVMRKTEGCPRLTNSQREALEMIQHKIGRALNGDPTYDDNWKDIAGYATLVAEELNGVKK